MSFGGGSAPKPAAKRPERTVEIQPEDIELGAAEEELSPLKKAGKRSLARPSGGAAAGLSI